MAITILESIAIIHLHVNGALLSGIVAIISGIALKNKEMVIKYGRIKSTIRNHNRNRTTSC